MVVDLTPPPVIPPDVGGGGGAWEPDEEIDTPAQVRRLADFDIGVARETAYVVDLTPAVVRRRERLVEQPPAPPVPDREAPEHPGTRILAAADAGVALDAAHLLDLTPAFEDEDEFEELLASGVLDMILS